MQLQLSSTGQEKQDENARDVIRLIYSGKVTNLNSICSTLTGKGYNPHYAEHLAILRFLQAVIKHGYVKLTRHRTSLENFIISERLELTRSGQKKFFELLDVDTRELKRDTATAPKNSITKRLDMIDLRRAGYSPARIAEIMNGWAEFDRLKALGRSDKEALQEVTQ
jgi:hypothetical protein